MQEIINSAGYTNKDLKFAIIGFGKMGVLHSGILNLLQPGCVKAIVDKSRLLIFGASKLIKCVNFYRDVKVALKKEDPNVVYVTTPAGTHYNIVSELLDACIKYIFVEKPPTINSAQLASLIDKMNHDQLVMVGFQKRFAMPFRHAKMLLSENVIGDVDEVIAYAKSGDITMSTTRFNAMGRGALLDLGIHIVDLLVWMINVNVVEASRFQRIHTEVDDYFEAKLRTKDDLRVNMEVTWSSSEHRLPETYIKISASNGVLEVTEDYLKVDSTERHPMLNNGTKLVMYRPNYYQGMPPVNLADPEYTLEDLHFLHNVYSSIEPLTSLRNVITTMKLIDELYEKAGI